MTGKRLIHRDIERKTFETTLPLSLTFTSTGPECFVRGGPTRIFFFFFFFWGGGVGGGGGGGWGWGWGGGVVFYS